MPSLERTIRIDTWTILKVIVILLALAFLFYVRDILGLLFAALFLAALMHPAARFFAKYRIPKGLTVLVLYVVLFGTAVLVVGILLPTLIEESAVLLKGFGISWQTLSDAALWLKQFSLDQGLTENIKAGIQTLESGQVWQAASGVFATVGSVFGGIVGFIVVLVMAYYMVVQEEEARNVFHNFVPDEYKDISASILKRVEEKIGKWLIGQLSLCVIIGTLYYIGLSVIGINSALVLASFGGFTEFIPYLGPILGAIPVFVLALTQSPLKAVLALVILILIQQLEGHVIVPKVMQKAVGLNPLISIVALLVGAELFGIIGALLAIPVATAISAVLSELYRHSAFHKT